MEEFDGIADHIFNDHSPSVPINELGWGTLHLIGEHHGWLPIVAQTFDEQLSYLVGGIAKLDDFFNHLRIAIGSGDIGESDLFPST